MFELWQIVEVPVLQKLWHTFLWKHDPVDFLLATKLGHSIRDSMIVEKEHYRAQYLRYLTTREI